MRLSLKPSTVKEGDTLSAPKLMMIKLFYHGWPPWLNIKSGSCTVPCQGN